MFKKHEDENLEEYKKRLKEQGITQEAYVALGVTTDYAWWYESEQIRRQIDSVNTRFQHLVRVMEERQKDQNKLIEQLMEANKNLSKKIKEMEK